ncbi:class I SAM-dependent methyltransferase [Saccharolobus solfataricus]|uniref:Ribosomal protein L11 methyltransferase, putative n=3 Tax=Saccharolobus solfataricus TaxID=2287 RepID=Q7LXU8_SACS2|nr:protein-lysine N-methyltransferase [Saccharolobus solfataricus]AAK40871.1 Ribosomal protein L11 methyltransferase, putative [Saccharolobus solfataricus P2]AKA73902.1 class I SAM-dependent methyltransferase [Saccharolobus solfataricus]AKA76600.1 class I SAM-dependent methyltransferase [Saccharolobus solfataricus]AKA79293.1 class I SAM-dependent methyltransferase [Saccharolobus solfataricus]AZF68377.1 class I SAM-dependent methyltransferase [Saccharolobus solfataricus]
MSYVPHVPYVPTPEKVVRRMLEIAKASQDDIVYDLGCGDGRIIITAVKDFNVKKAIGVEINDERIREALANIEKNGVTGRASIVKGNFFEVDISEATVVTMFLLTNVNEMLKPKLEKELKPGTRVVSHEFEIRGWNPKEVVKVEDGNMNHTVYLYVIGEHK